MSKMAVSKTVTKIYDNSKFEEALGNFLKRLKMTTGTVFCELDFGRAIQAASICVVAAHSSEVDLATPRTTARRDISNRNIPSLPWRKI